MYGRDVRVTVHAVTPGAHHTYLCMNALSYRGFAELWTWTSKDGQNTCRGEDQIDGRCVTWHDMALHVLPKAGMRTVALAARVVMLRFDSALECHITSPRVSQH
jgi:hypothetical protein